MTNQKSIISYVPQPFFGTSSVTVTKMYDVDIIKNSQGMLDPDLTNYTTLVSTPSGRNMGVSIDFAADTAWLKGLKMTIGVIGCSLLTYEDDGFGNPDPSTETAEDFRLTIDNLITSASENPSYLYAHGSQNEIKTFGNTSLPGIIAGGNVNLVRNGYETGDPVSSPRVTLLFQRFPPNVTLREHSKIIIGHIFIGVDIDMQIDPSGFSWGVATRKNAHKLRSLHTINSDGVIFRTATFDAIKIKSPQIIGLNIDPPIPPSGELTFVPSPSLFDLVKANNSYPLLFSPYPHPEKYLSDITLHANLSVRCNFYSIYGYLDSGFEVQLREFRDGLNSEYRARFGITETR